MTFQNLLCVNSQLRFSESQWPLCERFSSVLRRRTVAVISLWCRSAQPQMLVSGAIKVLPIAVKEYSTATDRDLVTRLAINPADSRLRSVLVRIRCETLSSCRSSSPLRYGFFCRADKISTVHLPMNMVETTLELEPDASCILFHPHR